MAKGEFKFKGISLEEMRQLGDEKAASMLGTRAKRKARRGFDKALMKDVREANEKKNAGKDPGIIRTHSRAMVVLPSMVGLKFGIHKGNEFQIVDITEKMLGHYLGELALTRKRLTHGKAGIGATKSSTAITARK